MMFYLFSVICFASFVQTELLSLPGCPRKCGNLTIPFPFGMTSECYFDETFHIICDRSFEPPKPFLRLLSAEVVSISLLDGRLELLNSSSSVRLERREGEILHMVVECHVARNNSSRYACRPPHSQCADSSRGNGHVCRCLPGYQGNPYLADGCQDIDECAMSDPCVGECVNLPGSFKCYCRKGMVGDGRRDGSGCSRTQDQINLSVFPLGIFVVAPFLLITWTTCTKKPENKLARHQKKLFEENGGNFLVSMMSRNNPQLVIYEVEEIYKITNSYSDQTAMLGCKPGTFYRGTLLDIVNPVEVVVVTVERVPEDQIKNFVDQLLFLAQPHVNLVRILGCCLKKQFPLIVYELYGDGNTKLSNFTGSNNERLSRAMWVEVAKGVARGLSHLNSHGFWGTFVHGNICSANIMMNKKTTTTATAISYDPKIFYAAGSNLFARAPDQENDLYRDPEPLNSKSDVYSFGVVLVELLTRGRLISQNFIVMAQANRLLEILDQEMIREGELVREVAALAHKCLNVRPDKRPKMKKVSKKLTSLMKMA